MWKTHYELMQARLAALRNKLPPQYPFLNESAILRNPFRCGVRLFTTFLQAKGSQVSLVRINIEG